MDTIFAQCGRAFLTSAIDLLTFPVWWYTSGVRRMVRWMGRSLRGWEHAVGLRLWSRSLFVPMFGQTDWQGRIISFGMRLAILIGRFLQVLAGTVAVLVTFLGYLVLPILALGLLVWPRR